MSNLILTQEKNKQLFFLDTGAQIVISKIIIDFNPYPGNQGWLVLLNQMDLMLKVKAEATTRRHEYSPIVFNAITLPYFKLPVYDNMVKAYPTLDFYGEKIAFPSCTFEMSFKPIENVQVALHIGYEIIGNVTLHKELAKPVSV